MPQSYRLYHSELLRYLRNFFFFFSINITYLYPSFTLGAPFPMWWCNVPRAPMAYTGSTPLHTYAFEEGGVKIHVILSTTNRPEKINIIYLFVRVSCWMILID